MYSLQPICSLTRADRVVLAPTLLHRLMPPNTPLITFLLGLTLFAANKYVLLSRTPCVRSHQTNNHPSSKNSKEQKQDPAERFLTSPSTIFALFFPVAPVSPVSILTPPTTPTTEADSSCPDVPAGGCSICGEGWAICDSSLYIFGGQNLKCLMFF